MNPKFKIGEQIILVTSDPDFNGEYCVTNVKAVENFPVTGKKARYDGFIYSIGCVGPNGQDLWVETCLRKRHDKGDMSFKSLMNSLKSPVLEWK